MYQTFTPLLLLLLFCSILLPSPITSQAIPDLPIIPPQEPSPVLTIGPTTITVPTALPVVAPTAAPSAVPTTAPTSNPPSPVSEVPTTATISAPPLPSPAAPSTSLPSTDPTLPEEKVCQRDPTKPRPRLGTSQARYALAVLGSAAAVGVASLLYSGVYTWNKNKDYTVWRYGGIVTARVLIYVAVRFSAALVATITKESPDDGALDASGAFLTWGSAIFTRMYHEGVVMTLAALNIMDNEHRWDDKLHEYLNPGKAGTSPKPDDENPLKSKSDVYSFVVDDDRSFWHRTFGGMLERKLLLCIAIVYFGQEIAVLVVNINNLIGSLERSEESVFLANDAQGQCSIDSGDKAFFFLVILLQCLYALTYQPSLIPLLMIGGFPKERDQQTKRQALLWKIQGLYPYIILFIWVASLALHPLLKPHLELIYLAGDTSLFWFVVLAPPSYSSPSFIVTLVYAFLAAIVGAFLLYRIRSSKTAKANY